MVRLIGSPPVQRQWSGDGKWNSGDVWFVLFKLARGLRRRGFLRSRHDRGGPHHPRGLQGWGWPQDICSSRGSRPVGRTRRKEMETRWRYQEWLHGTRSDFWASVHTRSPSQAAHPRPAVGEKDFGLPPSVSSRVCTLIQEGALRSACAALLQRPPKVIRQLRLLHLERRPQKALSAWTRPLRTISLLAAPPTDFGEVFKSIRSLLSTSSAGPSGPPPNHVKEALRLASADTTKCLLSKVVMLMLQGVIPETVWRFLRGASLACVRRKARCGHSRPGTASVASLLKFAWKASGRRCRRFSNPSTWGSEQSMSARRPLTRLACGSLATASSHARLLLRSVCPAPPTAPTGRRCSAARAVLQFQHNEPSVPRSLPTRSCASLSSLASRFPWEMCCLPEFHPSGLGGMRVGRLWQFSSRSGPGSQERRNELHRRAIKARAPHDATGRSDDDQEPFFFMRSWLVQDSLQPPHCPRRPPGSCTWQGRHRSSARSRLLLGHASSDDEWHHASFGISAGGFLVRSACEHAHAAYLPKLRLKSTARLWQPRPAPLPHRVHVCFAAVRRAPISTRSHSRLARKTSLPSCRCLYLSQLGTCAVTTSCTSTPTRSPGLGSLRAR